MSRIFHYDCPGCGKPGSSTKLVYARRCPECGIDVYDAWERQARVNSALGQTNRAIALIEGLISPNRIETAVRNF